MKNPTHFVTKCPYVFFLTLVVIVFLDCTAGFLGYLRYGEKTQENILSNVFQEHPLDPLALSAQYVFVFSLLVSHTLVLFVPTNVIWNQLKEKVAEKKQYIYYVLLRVALATFTVALAAAIPNLGPIMSLAGSFSFPLVGLLIPAVVEIAGQWKTGLGLWKWVLWKDIILIIFAVTVSISGVFSTIRGLILSKTT